MADRLVKTAGFLQQPAQRVVRGGEARVELEHFLVGGNGFVKLLAVDGCLGEEGQEKQ